MCTSYFGFLRSVALQFTPISEPTSMSVPVVRVFSGSALTICCDLASSRDDTFDGSALFELFHKVSVLSLGITFRVWVSASV